jgi:2,3-bisphosphoglycerate-independent phosphoglycerate mutase
MKSFTSGHISSTEATALLTDLQKEVDDCFEFKPGVSYRNLLLFRGDQATPPFSMETRCTPPHDLTDKSVADDFPRGPGCGVLHDIMAKSSEIFENHPVNKARIEAGSLPATNVWLWGCGKAPKLASFEERFGKTGAMITAVDLLRGIAQLIKWNVIEVPGATGYTDTDYVAKGQYAIDNLDKTDVVCVHVEATDEASHEGDVDKKIEALQEIDSKIVAPLCQALESIPHRILITPDHPTYLRTKTHSHGFVPFTAAGKGIDPDESKTYDEVTAAAGETKFPSGCELMDFFLQ